MRKKMYITGAISLILAISVLAFSLPETSRRPSVHIPENAVQIAHGVYYLGTASFKGEEVEGYMFVHYKNGFQKGGPNGAGGASSTCYSYLAQGARWKDTESYVLDTANIGGMSDNFVANAMQLGLDAWDSQVGFKIFGSKGDGTVDGADTSAPDGKNEIMFGAIDSPNVIAVTTVWGIFGGSPKNRKLVEFDAVFDDSDFKWGDALATPGVMDLQNIATHELGHAAGMGHPSDSCTEETMYRYASSGETKKRDLNSGDISGIKSLYK